MSRKEGKLMKKVNQLNEVLMMIENQEKWGLITIIINYQQNLINYICLNLDKFNWEEK